MDAWSYLVYPAVGDAWERMFGTSGDAWERLPGTVGDAWERLIAGGVAVPFSVEIVDQYSRIQTVVAAQS